MKYILITIMIAAFVALSGCGSEPTEEGTVIEHEPEDGDMEVVVTDESDNASQDADPSDDQADDNNETDAKSLLEQMNKDAGLIDNNSDSDDEDSGNETDTGDNETSEEDEEAGIHEITMINFQGEPEDIEIDVGDTVKWTSEQPNFRHRINILRYEDDGTKSRPLLDPGMDLLNGQTVEHIFNKTGEYLWYSTTNYPGTSGDVTVE